MKMINIQKINDKKFKSIYFSFNYTINANKKEMTESAILASIMSKSSRNIITKTN